MSEDDMLVMPPLATINGVWLSDALLDRLLAMTDDGLRNEIEDDTHAWNVLLDVRRELLLIKQGRGELRVE